MTAASSRPSFITKASEFITSREASRLRFLRASRAFLGLTGGDKTRPEDGSTNEDVESTPTPTLDSTLDFGTDDVSNISEFEDSRAYSLLYSGEILNL
jgi:hypothetical protein